MQIQIASTDTEIQACFPVIAELRPKLAESEFVALVRRQESERFCLAYAHEAGAVRAVAGFRFMQKLVSGSSLYVDDLVTQSDARSRGYGHALLDWLVALARERGCGCLELDSGVQRFAAHRFYMRERMSIASHHFVLEL